MLLKYFTEEAGWVIKGNYNEIRFRRMEGPPPERIIQCFGVGDDKTPSFWIKERAYCSAYILNDEGKTIERIN